MIQPHKKCFLRGTSQESVYSWRHPPNILIAAAPAAACKVDLTVTASLSGHEDYWSLQLHWKDSSPTHSYNETFIWGFSCRNTGWIDPRAAAWRKSWSLETLAPSNLKLLQPRGTDRETFMLRDTHRQVNNREVLGAGAQIEPGFNQDNGPNWF